jgi:hypothetical protein
MSMKNSNDTIGNQTHDLPNGSAVPQPTALLRAPGEYGGCRMKVILFLTRNSQNRQSSVSRCVVLVGKHNLQNSTSHVVFQKCSEVGQIKFSTHYQIRGQ